MITGVSVGIGIAVGGCVGGMVGGGVLVKNGVFVRIGVKVGKISIVGTVGVKPFWLIAVYEIVLLTVRVGKSNGSIGVFVARPDGSIGVFVRRG